MRTRMPSCTVAPAEKEQDAKGFENCWRGGPDGAKREAGGKTLLHAAGGLELNMEAAPKEFEAIPAAAEDAANAANGFEVEAKEQDAKGFENCWRGGADGAKGEAGGKTGGRASRFVSSITIGAEEHREEWAAVGWGCG
jgi:hypothetical protein